MYLHRDHFPRDSISERPRANPSRRDSYLRAENFEQYARKQYYAKAPDRNPFGDDEQAIKFNDLDVFKKIRVLQQFSAWSLWNPDKIRDRMTEKETEQVQWVG